MPTSDETSDKPLCLLTLFHQRLQFFLESVRWGTWNGNITHAHRLERKKNPGNHTNSNINTTGQSNFVSGKPNHPSVSWYLEHHMYTRREICPNVHTACDRTPDHTPCLIQPVLEICVKQQCVNQWFPRHTLSFIHMVLHWELPYGLRFQHLYTWIPPGLSGNSMHGREGATNPWPSWIRCTVTCGIRTHYARTHSCFLRSCKHVQTKKHRRRLTWGFSWTQPSVWGHFITWWA